MNEHKQLHQHQNWKGGFSYYLAPGSQIRPDADATTQRWVTKTNCQNENKTGTKVSGSMKKYLHSQVCAVKDDRVEHLEEWRDLEEQEEEVNRSERASGDGEEEEEEAEPQQRPSSTFPTHLQIHYKAHMREGVSQLVALYSRSRSRSCFNWVMAVFVKRDYEIFKKSEAH